MSKTVSKHSSNLLSSAAGLFVAEADNLRVLSFDVTNAAGFPPKGNTSRFEAKPGWYLTAQRIHINYPFS